MKMNIAVLVKQVPSVSDIELLKTAWEGQSP